MEKPFFIMMYWQNGKFATPIMNGDEDVAFFSTEMEARRVAENHEACQAFGYEIFEMGTGL